MPIARTRLLLRAWIAGYAIAACGGHADEVLFMPVHDASADATAGDRAAASPMDASQSEVVSEAGVDADAADTPLPYDAPTSDAGMDSSSPASIESCHITWPQSVGAVQLTQLLAVDSTGNAYLAINHGEPPAFGSLGATPPPLDLGMTSAGYLTGTVIAKVDPRCKVLWVREIGAPTYTSLTDLHTYAIAVDADSNVTVLGGFAGSVDLAGLAVATPGPDASGTSFFLYGYLLRYAANGDVVFAKIFRSNGAFGVVPAVLAVAPSGLSAVVAMGGDVADFGDEADASVFPRVTSNVCYLARFDAAGNLVARRALSLTDGLLNVDAIAFDSAENLWGIGAAAPDAGQGPVVALFAASGAVAWLQPNDARTDLLAAGPAGALVFDDPYGDPPQTVTLRGYAPDGGLPWSRQTILSNAVFTRAAQMVLDKDGGALVGGQLSGVVEAADGSTTSVGAPTGAAFQRYDSTGAFVSWGTWAGIVHQSFGGVGASPEGEVVLTGEGSPADAGPTLFLVRLVP
jgi:hypothetical protein